MKQLGIFFIAALLLPNISVAQQFRIQPAGIMGSAGFGFAHFDVQDPNTQNLEIDDGVFAAVGGEKGFDVLNSYLTISLNYLKADGDTKYDYTTANGATNYSSGANLVSFSTDLFQAGLGLKFKLIDDYWFRPYVEGGGLFGYFQIKYSNLQVGSNITLTGTDTGLRRKDSIYDLGYYGEGGLEISFSDTFGIKAAYRLTKNKTKEFETLADQRVEYESQVYYLSLLKKF